MRVTITQTSGVVLSLGFGADGSPVALSTAPLLSALATDHVLVERAGVLVKVSAADLVAAVLAALPTTLPSSAGRFWWDGSQLSQS